MCCYNSYCLIFDTAMAPKSVHKIMIDTHIRLYLTLADLHVLTHADLQVNICVNIKSLIVILFYKYLLFDTYAWVFILIGACVTCAYIVTLLLLNMSEYTS